MKNNSVTPYILFDKDNSVTPYVIFHDDQRKTTLSPLMFHLVKTTVLPPMFSSIHFDSVTPYGFFMTTDKERQCYPLRIFS